MISLRSSYHSEFFNHFLRGLVISIGWWTRMFALMWRGISCSPLFTDGALAFQRCLLIKHFCDWVPWRARATRRGRQFGAVSSACWLYTPVTFKYLPHGHLTGHL